jgi:maltose alpha-D-glucosyltransferase/alpha-amylase
LTLLGERLAGLPEDARPGRKFFTFERTPSSNVFSWHWTRVTAMRIRCHGDYHLGQLLFTSKDFVVIDFGRTGATARRGRAKRSALVNVAAMLRSIDYAAIFALKTGEFRQRTGCVWGRGHRLGYWVADDFLESYRSPRIAAGFLPASMDEVSFARRCTLRSEFTG